VWQEREQEMSMTHPNTQGVHSATKANDLHARLNFEEGSSDRLVIESTNRTGNGCGSSPEKFVHRTKETRSEYLARHARRAEADRARQAVKADQDMALLAIQLTDDMADIIAQAKEM